MVSFWADMLQMLSGHCVKTITNLQGYTLYLDIGTILMENVPHSLQDSEITRTFDLIPNRSQCDGDTYCCVIWYKERE